MATSRRNARTAGGAAAPPAATGEGGAGGTGSQNAAQAGGKAASGAAGHRDQSPAGEAAAGPAGTPGGAGRRGPGGTVAARRPAGRLLGSGRPAVRDRGRALRRRRVGGHRRTGTHPAELDVAWRVAAGTGMVGGARQRRAVPRASGWTCWPAATPARCSRCGRTRCGDARRGGPRRHGHRAVHRRRPGEDGRPVRGVHGGGRQPGPRGPAVPPGRGPGRRACPPPWRPWPISGWWSWAPTTARAG